MAVIPVLTTNPEPNVIPNCAISAAGAGSLPAGSVTISAPWCGFTQYNCDDADETGLVVGQICRVPKVAGGGTAITAGNQITFELVGGAGVDQDAYTARKSAGPAPGPATDVHAYALEDAADGATDVLVRMLIPPYHDAI